MKDNITGLLIAAGYSSRYPEFKPFAEYNGRSFLDGILQKMLKVCRKVVIVTGHRADEVKRHIMHSEFIDAADKSSIKIVHNPDYDKGMFTSLQKGLAAVRFTDWVLYHFVDQPALPEKFYEEFVEQLDEKSDWIQPAYKGRTGHPVLISSKLFDVILKEEPDSNLREVMRKADLMRKISDCGYTEIHNDIDTPEDYKALLKK